MLICKFVHLIISSQTTKRRSEMIFSAFRASFLEKRTTFVAKDVLNLKPNANLTH